MRLTCTSTGIELSIGESKVVLSGMTGSIDDGAPEEK